MYKLYIDFFKSFFDHLKILNVSKKSGWLNGFELKFSQSFVIRCGKFPQNEFHLCGKMKIKSNECGISKRRSPFETSHYMYKMYIKYI